MQAGGLVDTRTCAMNAVPLVLRRHDAQLTMIFVHLRSNTLNYLYHALRGDANCSEPPSGPAALEARATQGPGDRERQAIGNGPPGTIATACHPSA
jgi:hypothetical protein